jgi:pimeloyl-ACP methyl ester carboxylesterase
VVAHDYGVSVGQELLARHDEASLPFTLAGMVFMNGGLTAALHRPLIVQQLLASPCGEWLAPLFVNRLTLHRSLARIMHKPEAIDIDEHWKGIAARDGAKRIPALLGYIRERRMFRERWGSALQNTKVPLAFAWGLRDPISGAHMLDWVREVRPDAEVLALSDAGHYPQLEQEVRVAAFVKHIALSNFGE